MTCVFSKKTRNLPPDITISHYYIFLFVLAFFSLLVVLFLFIWFFFSFVTRNV